MSFDTFIQSFVKNKNKNVIFTRFLYIFRNIKTNGEVEKYLRAFLSAAVKVKLKFTMKQATKAQRLSRGIALLLI
jgi:hypothetical protein